MVILITGGAGFIGSNLIHYWLEKHPGDTLLNFDALTYAGNPANLAGVESNTNYHFFHGDLRKKEQLDEVFERYSIDAVIHLAAESHVDRSINDPSPFIETNINGTFHLLEVARKHWQDDLKSHRFVHVSTIAATGPGEVDETTDSHPISNYGQSKGEGEQAVRENRKEIPLTIVRPPVVYGERDEGLLDMFRMLQWGLRPRIGGPKWLSIVHARDLVEGMVQAAESPVAENETYSR